MQDGCGRPRDHTGGVKRVSQSLLRTSMESVYIQRLLALMKIRAYGSKALQ
jgi:hypothetical protein